MCTLLYILNLWQKDTIRANVGNFTQFWRHAICLLAFKLYSEPLILWNRVSTRDLVTRGTEQATVSVTQLRLTLWLSWLKNLKGKRIISWRGEVLAVAPLCSMTTVWYTCLSLLENRQRLALLNNDCHCTDSSHSSSYWLGSPIHQHLSQPIIYTARVNSHRHNVNHGTSGPFWSALFDTQSCLSKQREMTRGDYWQA